MRKKHFLKNIFKKGLTFQKSYDIIFIESKESTKVATEKK
jgi:hypothetical protein